MRQGLPHILDGGRGLAHGAAPACSAAGFGDAHMPAALDMPGFELAHVARTLKIKKTAGVRCLRSHRMLVGDTRFELVTPSV